MRRTSVAAGLGIALCLAAGAFAAEPLYVPGLALLLMAAIAAGWVSLAARGAQVLRLVGGAAVEEQTPLRLTVRVQRSGLPPPSAEVQAFPEGSLTPLRGGTGATVTTAVRFPRRGRHRLGPASVTISDPLGLCRRAAFSAFDEVLVLPRILPLHSGEVGGAAGVLWSRRASTAEEGANEVDSLQEYRPGSPASRIHWPTVARTTSLMERRLVADEDQRPLVVVDPREPSSAAALDDAMRASASLCVHLARHGGCALLLPSDRRPTRLDPELHGFAELHARLALLEPEAGGPPLGCLTGAEVVLWVTAATGGSTVLAQLRAPVRYLVSPHPESKWHTQFTVAGCSGQRLERARTKRRAAA